MDSNFRQVTDFFGSTYYEADKGNGEKTRMSSSDYSRAYDIVTNTKDVKSIIYLGPGKFEITFQTDEKK